MQKLLCVTFMLLVAAPCMGADAYPSKPVRWMVPFPPGGGTDLISRTIAAKLTEAWGVQVVADNRPGGGGTLGLGIAAKTPPDGYTIVLGQASNVAVAPALYAKLTYDPVKDLQPITNVIAAPLVIVSHPSFPARNAKEMIAYARAKPGAVTFGSPGNGTIGHLSMELLKTMAKINMLHIPYKGATLAITELIGGQIVLYASSMPPALPLINAGKLKALGVTTAQAPRAAAERADDRRERRGGIRGGELVRRVRAGGRAQRHRREAAHRYRARVEAAGRERALRRRRRRHRRRHAGRIRRVRAQGNPEVGQGSQRRLRQGGLTAPRFLPMPTLSIEALTALATDALSASGASASAARITAKYLVAADAQGLGTHGVVRVPTYCDHLKCGRAYGDAVPRIANEKAAACLVDAGYGLGFEATEFALKQAVERAAAHGVGFAGVTKSHHCGALGILLEPVAARGMVGIAFSNAPSAIMAWGGTKPIFGTNPVAAIFPRA